MDELHDQPQLVDPPNSSSSLYGNSCYDSNDTGRQRALPVDGRTPSDNGGGREPRRLKRTALCHQRHHAAHARCGESNYLTGVSSILCESNQQLNKTGTLMLNSPEPANLAPQSVTVTMQGAGFRRCSSGWTCERPASLLRRVMNVGRLGHSPSARDRYTENGDTLVEVLLAIVVLGIAAVALLTAFATSIGASAEHRNSPRSIPRRDWRPTRPSPKSSNRR